MVLRIFLYTVTLVLSTSCSGGNASVNPINEEVTVASIEPKSLYVLHCESCHGLDGKKGLSGAKDLSKSRLFDKQIKKVILNGNRKGMMPYKDLITNPIDIDNLVQYVKTLRK